MTVTLEQVKQYLRYAADETEQDGPLAGMIAAGQNWVERHTHKAFADYDAPEDIPAVMLQAVCIIAAMTDEERSGGGDGWKNVEWLLESYHRPAVA